MANGSHGSLERTPGALFRAMGALILRKKDCSREALARELKEHLETRDVRYHIRTLRRQLTGSVSSVPPEVQGAMRHVLLRANGLRTDVGIDRALRTAGLWVAPEDRQPKYLCSERIVPLAQLWLLFNRTRSKRALAKVLSRRLARQGVRLKVDPLQNILAGRQPLARREVHEALLALLSAHGIASEDEARARWQRSQQEIADYFQARALEPAERLVDLARAWKLRNHQPSSRHLAVILQEKLRQRGIDLCLDQTQKAVDGRFKTVRHALIVEMEALLRQSLPEGHDLAGEVAAAAEKQANQIDLCWVKAEPIAALAKAWLSQRPGATMRQLSIRVANTARRMGYATSYNTTQPILGGYKKRTRGFVYRALLKQIEGREREPIPEEHILRSHRAVDSLDHARRRFSSRKRALAKGNTVAQPDHSYRSTRAAAPSESGGGSADRGPQLLGAYLREARPIPLLSYEEQVRLARRIEDAEREIRGIEEHAGLPLEALERTHREVQAAERRATQAKNELVTANLRLVVAIAKKYLGRGLDFLDLIQEGNIGLMRAVDRFDYRRGYRLTTYATWWIRQHIERAIANQSRTIRLPAHVHYQAGKLRQTAYRYLQAHGRPPTLEELAASAELPLEKAREAMQFSYEPVSLDAPIGDGETLLGELLEDRAAVQPLDAVIEMDLIERVRKALPILTPREAHVLRLRYGIETDEAHGRGKVAQDLGVTAERVRQIEVKALANLQRLSLLRHRAEVPASDESGA